VAKSFRVINGSRYSCRVHPETVILALATLAFLNNVLCFTGTTLVFRYFSNRSIITFEGGQKAMPKVAPFYSVNEAAKPLRHRVYHDNNNCPPGRDIPKNEQRPGTGGYRLCENCQKLDQQGR
jgi:hypothetical protein